MMCPHMEATLSEYVDGTLSVLQREPAAGTLAQCAGCRDAVAELRRLVAGARHLPPSIVPPRDLWPVIGRRIGQRAAWNVQRVWWRGALAAAAVCVMALGIYRLTARPPDRRGGGGGGLVPGQFGRARGDPGAIFAPRPRRARAPAAGPPQRQPA